MSLQKIGITLGLAIGMLALVGCSKPDHKKEIIGVWRLHSINANGQEIGDGKGFITFKEDGRAITRTGPKMYEIGKYEINPEIGEIKMYRDTAHAEYKYELWDDSLLMTRKTPRIITVLRGVKSPEMPIDPKTEGADPKYFE